MINLKNTYVPNANGALADLYVAECEKQGFGFQANSAIGDGWKYLFVVNGNLFTSNCLTGEKELTIDDFRSTEQQVSVLQTAIANSDESGLKDVKIRLRDKMLQRKHKRIKAQAAVITKLLADKAELKQQVFELNKTIGDNIQASINSILNCSASNGKVPLSTLSHGAIANNKANIAFERASAACNGMVYHKALTCEEIAKIGAEPEITMEIEEDKMKRTVITYEKVKFDKLSEAFAEHEKEPLRTDVTGKHTLSDEGVVFRFNCDKADMYRKVTTEITPMQAAKDAMRKYICTSEEIDEDDESDTFLSESLTKTDFDYDNEYIAMIRATLNAYDAK